MGEIIGGPVCSHGNPLDRIGCTDRPITKIVTAGNPPLYYCTTHLPDHILFLAEHHFLVVLERL